MQTHPLYAELPYSEDSVPLFEAVRLDPWPIFLDSGWPTNSLGRFDIIAADPFVTLKTTELETTICKRGHTFSSIDNPFTLLRSELYRYRNQKTPFSTHELPMIGGAMGYFSYDLVRYFEKLPTLALDRENMPEMAIGIYDWVIIVDHHQQRCFLVGQGYDAKTRERWEALKHHLRQVRCSPPQTPFHLSSQIISNLDRQDYHQAFTHIQCYIREGDCYQVNLSQRFEAFAQGDPWALYRRLRLVNGAPFSAYFTIPEGTILSTSPERFLQVDATGTVETRPIKGTRPRSANSLADQQLALELQHSPKDRAENVMIVDLLRNDLGRVCTPGTIHVPSLCTIESFATVHHLVSTIRGQLAPKQDSLALLQACFPGGSVTGVPKIRAMEIIEELEPHRRGIYCGSLGYLDFEGKMDTNIAIRTLVHNQGCLRFWAGGGIVADSMEEDEYQETLTKAAAILSTLTEYTRLTHHPTRFSCLG
ncbi:para-aminobenzoate synthase subunit I [Candidatus Nitrosoglobus terrae]|uniref:aminodeoxychorismate synthase n=1 Tax=Candidatus Nitrosoglobus terrae TaxID=1630141 RepID=A0A1Q2SPT8_9GAMM|nr:aminodeoxychorismate synthase component I [Candidatus Nitrosoglobus terrae]BAW81131.1 para-aminobenzoate synthase subunit I [Candidatus Nitrosoglobus terrae]